MNKKNFCKSCLGAVLALAFAASTAGALPNPASAPSISSFAAQYNDKVAKLSQSTYKGMRIRSYTVKSDKATFVLNGAPKQSYVQSTNMRASLTGQTNADKDILEMTLSASPKKESDAMKDAYTTEWTTAATLMLTSLCPLASDEDARNLLQNQIGMPITTGNMLGKTMAREFTGDFGGQSIVASGGRDNKGIVTLTVKMNGAADGSDDSSPSDGKATQLIAGKTVDVKLGEAFYLDLSNNAGTGYTWEYNSEGPGASRLISVKTTESSNMPGGKLTERWSFDAARIGKQTLRFTCARSWEGVQSSDQTLTFTVNIVR